MTEKFFIAVTTVRVNSGINGYKPNMKEWIPGSTVKAPAGENIPVYSHPDNPVFLYGLWNEAFTTKVFEVEVVGESEVIPSEIGNMKGQKVLTEEIVVIGEVNVKNYQ